MDASIRSLGRRGNSHRVPKLTEAGIFLETYRDGEENAHFEWIIEGWSQWRGKDIWSPCFPFPDTKWQLCLALGTDVTEAYLLLRQATDEVFPCWLGVWREDGGEEDLGTHTLESRKTYNVSWKLFDLRRREKQLAPCGTLTILLRIWNEPQTGWCLFPFSNTFVDTSPARRRGARPAQISIATPYGIDLERLRIGQDRLQIKLLIDRSSRTRDIQPFFFAGTEWRLWLNFTTDRRFQALLYWYRPPDAEVRTFLVFATPGEEFQQIEDVQIPVGYYESPNVKPGRGEEVVWTLRDIEELLAPAGTLTMQFTIYRPDSASSSPLSDPFVCPSPALKSIVLPCGTDLQIFRNGEDSALIDLRIDVSSRRTREEEIQLYSFAGTEWLLRLNFVTRGVAASLHCRRTPVDGEVRFCLAFRTADEGQELFWRRVVGPGNGEKALLTLDNVGETPAPTGTLKVLVEMRRPDADILIM